MATSRGVGRRDGGVPSPRVFGTVHAARHDAPKRHDLRLIVRPGPSVEGDVSRPELPPASERGPMRAGEGASETMRSTVQKRG